MPFKFNIVERGNPANPSAPKKYYPSIQSSGRKSLRQLKKSFCSRKERPKSLLQLF
jgi:hypothetical protein